MKKDEPLVEDDLRPEYRREELGEGVRGKYYYAYTEGTDLGPIRRKWSQDFLELAGSAPDFPYPEEPPPIEPGPGLEPGRPVQRPRDGG